MRNGENTAERGKGMIGVTLLIFSWKRGGGEVSQKSTAMYNRIIKKERLLKICYNRV
jgi:hypothetical protein